MSIEYIAYGDDYPDLDLERLISQRARATYTACKAKVEYEIVALRQTIKDGKQTSETIIVDCVYDQIPSRNTVGINPRERLALVFSLNAGFAPEVKALRKNFPIVPHLNHVPLGEPASLCIYFEPWSAIERSWTPQNYLQRVLWWLSETAKGTLHRSDQPVERLYFNSPFELVLPPDFDEKADNPEFVFLLQHVKLSTKNDDFKLIRGVFHPKNKDEGVTNNDFKKINPLLLSLDPIIHGPIERYPSTLGDLCDQLSARGTDLIAPLKRSIQEKVGAEGINSPQGNSLLILHLPVKRTEDTPPELEVRSFWVDKELTSLGVELGTLFKDRNSGPNYKFYKECPVGDAPLRPDTDIWRQAPVFPIDVKNSITHEFARSASGVNTDTADFSGVLGGVGALGGVLSELWSKEAWGTWTLIDDDIVKAHNVVRHIGKEGAVGHYKVEIVQYYAESNYCIDYHKITAIPGSITNWQKSNIKESVISATLLVDATTTLDVPRDLAMLDETPRSVSVFLTPSGNSSVLLFEDSNRTARLDSLEAQYYRAIISSAWGSDHLKGHLGNLWVGAGCRDMSVVMSFESIQLHGAILAKQIRKLHDQTSSYIRVWVEDQDNCQVESYNISVSNPIRKDHNGWKVVLDEYLQEKLKKERQTYIPNETGGVIIGYIDHKFKSIYVIDVLPAPSDSKKSQSGFTRGVNGLEVTLNEISDRTAGIVQYIGEWHSHPAFASAVPSSIDQVLLQKLADTLALDGQPALMIIIGSAGEINISVKCYE